MNSYVNWADVAVIFVLLVMTLKGFTRGFVAEIGGLVSILAACLAALYYNGVLDGWLEFFRLNAATAHAAGMVLCAILVYAAFAIAFGILRRLTKLPGLGTLNALAGAVVGCAKGILALWIVVFIALLFPLTSEIRDDMKRSHFVPLLVTQERNAGETLFGLLPSLARPYVRPMLDRQQL